ADAADGRYAEGDEVAIALGAVALEVPVQAPLAPGHGERVVGQGEVVHADVAVVLREEAGDRVAEHGDALRGARQVGIGDAPLRLEALGQVRVGVQGDAV